MNSKFVWKSAGRGPKLDPNVASGFLYSFRLLGPGASSYLNTFDELYSDLIRIGAQPLSIVSFAIFILSWFNEHFQVVLYKHSWSGQNLMMGRVQIPRVSKNLY